MTTEKKTAIEYHESGDAFIWSAGPEDAPSAWLARCATANTATRWET